MAGHEQCAKITAVLSPSKRCKEGRFGASVHFREATPPLFSHPILNVLEMIYLGANSV